MPKTVECRTVSESIGVPRDEVCAFVRRPENLPRWASGLARSVREVGGEWLVESPAGPVRLRFAPENGFGVLDHSVTPSGGAAATVHVPMRVVANGQGSEVMLTLFRQPGMDDAAFDADTEWVRRDLRALRQLLENR